jgi:hypothetical protein
VGQKSDPAGQLWSSPKKPSTGTARIVPDHFRGKLNVLTWVEINVIYAEAA